VPLILVIVHQLPAASSWWCPHPSFERWIEMGRQLPCWVRSSVFRVNWSGIRCHSHSPFVSCAGKNGRRIILAAPADIICRI